MSENDMLREMHRRAPGIHEKIARDAKLGDRVWCRTCGREQKVNPAHCLAHGWPLCCGATMSIDHPDTWKPTP